MKNWKHCALFGIVAIIASTFSLQEVWAQQRQNAIAQFLTESLGKPISEAGMRLPVRSREVYKGSTDIKYGITVDGITFEYSETDNVIWMASRSLVVDIPTAGVAQLMQNFDREAQDVISSLKSDFSLKKDVSRVDRGTLILYSLQVRPNNRIVFLGEPRNNIIITITLMSGSNFVRIDYSATVGLN